MRQPTLEEWSIIRDQLDRLGALPHARQIAAIDHANFDPFVANELRSLLAAERRAGMLDGPLVMHDPGVPYASLPPGTMFDGYTIERLIGRGGMGEVYLSTRAGVGFSQQVALKMLRPEAVAQIAAFDSERALLATLEHPGIARLIDGGIAPDGRPYMAIEYVEGHPINQWCTDHKASLEQRLRLLLNVCEAVSHAHARMIIHRDIKPQNILIDGEGRPRLLDFGVAKLIDASNGENTVTMAMLTPDYAAPEQLMSEESTAATDVYALGAVLFELLTGSRPWQTPGARLPSILRRILDDDPPSASHVARTIQAPPVAAREIAGDLDAIVGKAMRRLPERRYGSIESLAADIKAHLALQPVSARTGSTAYLMSRFIRRHRWGVAGAVAAVLTLVGGTSGIAWQARQTATERDFAFAEAARLEGVNRAMLMMFRDAKDLQQLETISARELIDGTTRRVLRSAPPMSGETAAMIAALADLYLIVESNREAKALITGALARGVGRAAPADLARLQLKLGTILAIERQPVEARRLLAAADRIWRTDPVRFRRERVEAVGAEALMLRHQGKTTAAITLLSDDMAEAERVYAAYDRDLALRYAMLAGLLIDVGRLDEATELLIRGDARLTQREGAPSPSGLSLRWLEAEALILRGDTPKALALLENTISKRRLFYGAPGELAIDLLRQGRLLHQVGRSAEALSAVRKALPIAVDYYGAESDPSVQIRIAEAEILSVSGRTEEAAGILAGLTPAIDRMPAYSLARARFQRSRAVLELKRGNPQAAQGDRKAAEAIAQRNGRGADLFRQEAIEIFKQVRLRHDAKSN